MSNSLQPPGPLLCPWDFPGKNTGVGCRVNTHTHTHTHTHTQWNTAAAAAKSLQSCLTLCDPIDGSPPGSPVPGILQARTLEWVAISFSNVWEWKVKVKSLSRVWLLVTILVNHKKEWNIAICNNMDGLGGDSAKWNKAEKEKYSMISLIYWI